jgi:cathepsin D
MLFWYVTMTPLESCNTEIFHQKNVYSVFRYNPPSVGFASLSSVAIAENGAGGTVPSATIGTVSAAVTNTSDAPRGHALSASLSTLFFLAISTLLLL